jgi:hypothetical protein
MSDALLKEIKFNLVMSLGEVRGRKGGGQFHLGMKKPLEQNSLLILHVALNFWQISSFLWSP